LGFAEEIFEKLLIVGIKVIAHYTSIIYREAQLSQAIAEQKQDKRIEVENINREGAPRITRAGFPGFFQ
jgi:hypothetical protein